MLSASSATYAQSARPPHRRVIQEISLRRSEAGASLGSEGRLELIPKIYGAHVESSSLGVGSPEPGWGSVTGAPVPDERCPQFGVLNAPQLIALLMHLVTILTSRLCLHELMKSPCIVTGEPLESVRPVPS